MAADGSVLISLGHLNQVISIAPDSGPVRWRLVGPGSDFTFAHARDRFYAPHTALPLANGNVLLFDNGTGRPYEEGGQFSRAVELELDLKRMVARRVWESGRRCTPRAAPACSACPNGTNGNTPDPVYGSSRAERCCRVSIIVVEVTPDGRTVWEVGHRSPESRISTACMTPNRSWARHPRRPYRDPNFGETPNFGGELRQRRRYDH